VKRNQGFMLLKHCQKETKETFRAGTITAEVSVQHIDLPPYKGPFPKNTWRKPVVGPPARPFAELQVVSSLEGEGWLAAWVYRPGLFMSSWEPRQDARLPAEARALHRRIGEIAGNRSGSWDVFAWRDGAPLFLELKRAGTSDCIRETQLIWRKAALEAGVTESAFAVVEWSGGVNAEPSGGADENFQW
jgi:hypothetical protein